MKVAKLNTLKEGTGAVRGAAEAGAAEIADDFKFRESQYLTIVILCETT